MIETFIFETTLITSPGVWPVFVIAPLMFAWMASSFSYYTNLKKPKAEIKEL